MVCFYSLHINIYVRACLGLVGLVNGDLDQFLKCDHTYDVTYMCILRDYVEQTFSHWLTVVKKLWAES